MKSKIANPSPLGSLGFGMTTVLYSMVGAGFFELNAMLLSMAIFLGGFAQLLAGYLEYKKGNTFGFTSYTMFGFYWHTLVSITLMPVLGLSSAPDKAFMGWFFILWTIFCVVLFVKSLKLDQYTKIVFATVVILFAVISLDNFVESSLVGHFAGYWGILVGFLAIYAAFRNFDA